MNQSVSIGDRLREERVRLGLNQTDFGGTGGVTKKTQMLYEGGERAPDALYLAAIGAAGADVGYIVLGSRDQAPHVVLTAEEQLMLGYFRDASAAVRKAAMAALLSSAPSPSGFSMNMSNLGDGNVQVGNKAKVRTKKN